VRIQLTCSTPLDVPLLIFCSAADQLLLLLILQAHSLGYLYSWRRSHSMPGQRSSPSLNVILTLSIVMLAFTSLFLIGQYDWSQEVSRFSFHKLIGVQLNRFIPNMNLNLPAWNVLRNILASLLGLFFPLLILQLYRTYNQGRISSKTLRSWLPGPPKLFLLILLGFLMLLDLLLTESRAPWVAYAVILASTAWWFLSRRLEEWMRFSHYTIFLVGIFIGLVLLLGLINLLSRDPRLLSLFPGPDTFTGRLEITSQSPYLASDTPYTGGGLGAFTALYSFYIRAIPFNAFASEDTGNALYQYILVEQGWLGLISLILLLVVTLYMGLVHINRPENIDNGFVVAGLVGVSIIILRSFVHAILGASRAIPFLLLPAGLIIAGLGPIKVEFIPTISSTRFRFNRRLVAALTIPILLLLAYSLLAPAPRAAWYANLGAIRMAQIQLAGWPTEAWEDGSSLPALAPAEALFQRSLALDLYNRTANHRLGLISLLGRIFPQPRFLETAYQVTPGISG
jgi:hypothetical protein